MIRQQAEKITKGDTNDFDKAVALQNWFRTGGGFTYSLDQRGGSGMDMLAHFVTDDRVGYCEQFASAMAAMGRSLGIPSRVVVGFLDGSPLPDGRILYTSDERHAWPEMYFSGVGWVRFEPTPAQRAGDTPAYTHSQTDTTLPTPSASATPTKTPAAKRDVAPVRRRPARTAPRPGCRGGRSGSCSCWSCCCSPRRASGRCSDDAGCTATMPCPSPRAPGPSSAPPPATSGSTGPSNARRASRRGA